MRRAWRRVRHILFDTGWTGAIEVLKIVSGLVVLTVLIRDLGPAAYGRFVAVQALAAILSVLSSAWVSMLMIQRVVQSGDAPRTAFAASLGLAGSASALALAFGVVLGPLMLPSIPAVLVIAFIAAELCNGVLISVSAAAVQVHRGIPAASRVRMLPTITRTLVIVGIAVTGNTNLASLAAALLVAYSILGTAVLVWTVRTLGLSLRPSRPTMADAREGLPYAGVLASAAIQEDSDKIIIVRFVDPVAAGLYAAAYRIVQLGFVPINALMVSTHPRFLTDDPVQSDVHRKRALRYSAPTALYGIVAAGGVIVLAPVVPVVFGDAYDGTQGLLYALAPLILLRSLHLFPLNALLGLRRYRQRFLAFFSASMLNVALNALLIPVLKVPGAIAATLVTEVVLTVIAWWALTRSQRQHDRAKAGTEPLIDDVAEAER